MSRRAARHAGIGALACAAVGLVVIVGTLGPETADRAASVVAALVALAGVALSVYGFNGRDSAPPPTVGPAGDPPGTRVTGEVSNNISGGTFLGSVAQGRDINRMPGAPLDADERKNDHP